MSEARDVRLSSPTAPLYSYSFQQLAGTPIQARPHSALPPTRIPSIFDASQTPLHTSSEDRRCLDPIQAFLHKG